MKERGIFRVAAVQAAPVFLDREGTLDKAEGLIREAARAEAKLVVFPEAFLPAYPLWVWWIPAGQSAALRELYDELLRNSVAVPGPETARLGAMAREAGVYLVMGLNERNTEGSGSSLYNTIVYFAPDGTMLGRHRKLVPTAGERLIHASGDGSTLEVFETGIGRLGGLICWENYMPLARQALYARGVELYVAPTWDHGEPWISTLRHIAKEGRVYTIGCSIAMRKGDIPERFAFKSKFMAAAGEWLNPGESAIADPDGRLVAGPVAGEEAILYAEVDPAKVSGPRYQLDVAGHYSRPDVFRLEVDRRERLQLYDAGGDEGPAGR